MIGIYKITNNINGKVYIGQAEDIDRRWKSHKRDYKVRKCSIYLAMRKYGIENFTFEVIEECKKEELNEKEIYYIEKFNSYIHAENSNGYNMTLGGDTSRGYRHSDEAKRKMSGSRPSISGENNHNYGKPISEEHKKKLSNLKKGVPLSEKTKAKMRIANRGENNGMYGKTHSEESRKRMSESHKGGRVGGKHPMAKRVVCEGKIYECIKDCAEAYGVTVCSMSAWLNCTNNMPQDFYSKELHFEGETMEQYQVSTPITGENHHRSKRVLCENIIFNCAKDVAKHYKINYGTLIGWLSKNDKMPQEWYDRGLHYEGSLMEEYEVQTLEKRRDSKRFRKIICEDKEFDCIKDCAKYYDVNYCTMKNWLRGTCKMRQDFIEKGLRYKE